MSHSSPSGDTAPAALPALAKPEINGDPGATSADVRLILPDPLPDDDNPFRVIHWILFTAYVAARHLTVARQTRLVELGRKMRTEEWRGFRVLHRQDDVDRQAVERKLDGLTFFRWGKAQSDARKLCAGLGIPFDVYDPLLKDAWGRLDAAYRIIWGVCDAEDVYCSGDLSSRLYELADSTTPAFSPHVRHAIEQGGKEGLPADAGGFVSRLLGGPADVELTPRETALLEAHLKQPLSLSVIQRERSATGTSQIQANRNKLKLIRDFNRRMLQNGTVAGRTSERYADRLHDLPPAPNSATAATDPVPAVPSPPPPETQHLDAEKAESRAVTEAILPALLSASDIAGRIQRNPKSVTSFLSRFAGKNPDCRVGTESKRRNEPGYLYRTADVWPALERWMKYHAEKRSTTEARRKIP